MEDRDKKSGGAGCAIGCLLVLLFLPVLYVLSVGPAAWLADQFPGAGNAIGMLYLPLGLLADAFSPMEQFLEWYIELWR